MARRGSSPSRGAPAFGRGRSPTARRAAPPAPQRAVAPQPTAQVAQPAPMAAAPGGGMMANIASTAAGVAIGHTVGHALTGALMGGSNHAEQPAPVEQAAAPQDSHYQQPLAGQNPCKLELEQFINCAQTQSNDLTLCEGFNQVLKECKVRYGHMYQ